MRLLHLLHERQIPTDILAEEYKASYRRAYREDDILANEKLSFADRVIFVTLERLYPTVTSTMTPILVWKLAKQAGASTRSVSTFFESMRERGYMDYRSKLVIGMVDGKAEYRREVSVQELSGCKRVDLLDTRDTPKRKEHRKKVKELLHCRACGSYKMRIEVHAVCESCGEVQ